MRVARLAVKVCLASAALAVLASGVVSAESHSDSQLAELEESLWEAWKNRESAPFEANLTEDTINYSGGSLSIGKASAIAAITGGACEVKGYSLDEIRVDYPAEGTAILTYTASQEGSCDGSPLDSRVFAASVYVLVDGEWKAAYYHETPIDD